MVTETVITTLLNYTQQSAPSRPIRFPKIYLSALIDKASDSLEPIIIIVSFLTYHKLLSKY